VNIVRCLILTALAGLALACAGCGATGQSRSGHASAVSVVTIDLGARRQAIQGFGSSERVWSDPHLSESPVTVVPPAAQAAILAALYRRLGLTRVRPVLDQGVQKTRSGTFEFGGKLADAHIAFVKQARGYGLRTFFPGPVYIEPWMTENDVDAYVEWAMTMLRHWRALGAEPPLYAPQNEPYINGDFSPTWLRDVVVRLGARLKKEGFRTKLVVPDDENPEAAYRRASVILADPEARQYVGAIAYHVYRGDPGDWPRLHALASRHGLPVWMTEWTSKEFGRWPSAFDWAMTVHRLLTEGGVGAVDYLWGFFGDWVGGESMISIHFDGGEYRSFSMEPVYWLTGQWSRFVRPGFRRVATSADRAPVPTTAFVGPRRLVVVALNPSQSSQAIRFGFRRGQVRRVRLAYRTSASDSWRVVPAPRVRNGSFGATLSPGSVTTFVLDRP
jgi:O-glycosyl hydrolase